jgi:putative membrane protein
MRWTTLEKIALGAFGFWFACGLIFTLGHIGPATVAAWPIPSWLHSFVALCLGSGDPILILLAFANTHLLAARHWGATVARRWALVIIVLSLVIETCGALTGFPFGVYSYTDKFGPVLGVVPMTIPLAWHVVLTNALFVVRTILPHLPRWGEAAGVGFIATLYDMILEPFATRVKDYWIWPADWQWHAGPVPVQNYIAWFVIGALLVFAFAPTSGNRSGRDPRPALILGATVVLFLAGILVA